jgi:hypothetical protein
VANNLHPQDIQTIRLLAAGVITYAQARSKRLDLEIIIKNDAVTELPNCGYQDEVQLVVTVAAAAQAFAA